MGFLAQFSDEADSDIVSDSLRMLAGKPKPKGSGGTSSDGFSSSDTYYYYDTEDQIKRVCYAFLLLSSGFKVLNIAQY